MSDNEPGKDTPATEGTKRASKAAPKRRVAAPAAASTEVQAATLKEIKGGEFVFRDNGFHPEMDAAKKALTEATKKGEEAGIKAAQAKVDTLEHAIEAANLKSVKDLKPEALKKIPGYKEETFKTAVGTLEKNVKSHKAFGILRAEGLGAALKNNFGGEAWKASKGKVIFKGAGVVVGLGAMFDAVARSEKKGAEGQPEKRGAIGRWTEFVLGAGIAAGSALSGRR